MAKERKYEPRKLIAMFRLAAELRERMLEGGFTDNGGAIHSAERILNILGMRLCYPEVSHMNNLRNSADALFSKAALAAHRRGDRVFIEHVSPHRALTRLAMDAIREGASDDDLIDFVRSHFQLALLTEDETTRLNKVNRSDVEPNRLGRVGIVLVKNGSEKTKRNPTTRAAKGGD